MTVWRCAAAIGTKGLTTGARGHGVEHQRIRGEGDLLHAAVTHRELHHARMDAAEAAVAGVAHPLAVDTAGLRDASAVRVGRQMGSLRKKPGILADLHARVVVTVDRMPNLRRATADFAPEERLAGAVDYVLETGPRPPTENSPSCRRRGETNLLLVALWDRTIDMMCKSTADVQGMGGGAKFSDQRRTSRTGHGFIVRDRSLPATPLGLRCGMSVSIRWRRTNGELGVVVLRRAKKSFDDRSTRLARLIVEATGIVVPQFLDLRFLHVVEDQQQPRRLAILNPHRRQLIKTVVKTVCR